MLPAALRMHRSADFSETVRRGARAGRGTLVVHGRIAPRSSGVHVGFVVSKAVGSAVVRNKVRRRLRGLVMEHIDTVPEGADLVVRALPPAAAADYRSLSVDFSSALVGAVSRAQARAAGRP
ncbi:ribonuclease P protein component [Isoptericola sp. b441]|uniref:Ribonuclease P protein component n=1 Tax=Actinotalea lenta TaxID=3064654 RepID=A0ABT9D6N4_9CELL|nr:ribonuclease P protein component [Isoptericola sp. b441]MDO8106180.1 ribonuclease P protein component [Isoptericola sp. b441]